MSAHWLVFVDQQDAHFFAAAVIENAVRVAQIITDTYHAPNKTPTELEAMIHYNRVDLLQAFSDACRKKFETNLSI